VLFFVGLGCTWVSIIGLRLAWELYDVMSTFPVPGPELVVRDTGPGAADVAMFVGIGLLGVGGLLMMLLSAPWRRPGGEARTVAE
jgi:hypothetical protein